MAKNNQLQQRSAKKLPTRRRAGKVIETTEELRIEEGLAALTLRCWVAYFWLGIFTLNAVSALSVVFLVGFGLMALSNNVVITLILETVAHTAALCLTMTRSLFPVR